MNCDILELFSLRHSFYNINSSIPINIEEVRKFIQTALNLYPSPFNSQSARVVLLLNQYHFDFWKIVQQTLYNDAPVKKRLVIQNKIQSFANGAGTILFYMDKNIILQQEKDFPLYASYFKNWGYQCNAILQFMIWTTLASQNIGASLQHYNPIIDGEVRNIFHIPADWELVAQMPFGGIDKIPAPHSVNMKASQIMILS